MICQLPFLDPRRSTTTVSEASRTTSPPPREPDRVEHTQSEVNTQGETKVNAVELYPRNAVTVAQEKTLGYLPRRRSYNFRTTVKQRKSVREKVLPRGASFSHLVRKFEKSSGAYQLCSHFQLLLTNAAHSYIQ